jgi:hypothetical protein
MTKLWTYDSIPNEAMMIPGATSVTERDANWEAIQRLQQIVGTPTHEHSLGSPANINQESIAVFGDYVFSDTHSHRREPEIKGLSTLIGEEVLAVCKDGVVMFHNGATHTSLNLDNFPLPVGIYTALK